MSHRLNRKKLLASLLSTILLFVSGAAMASQDIQVLTKACVACHGKNGNSNNSAWPNLAGQKRTYLAIQLRNFRSGARKNLLMDDIVKNLSDTQIEALANYYSEQSVVIKKHEIVNQQGRNIRSHCLSCHGYKGITVNQQWPNLAGQQKNYLQAQLLAFKQGTRISPEMQVIAKELSDSQIEAVAEYYSQL